jgi:hypothetical protein
LCSQFVIEAVLGGGTRNKHLALNVRASWGAAVLRPYKGIGASKQA